MPSDLDVFDARSFMSANTSMKPLLIKFDVGFLKRIELEVVAVSIEAGRDAHRTEVIRDLITEGLDARCARRDEGVPYVVPVSQAELMEGAEDEGEAEEGEAEEGEEEVEEVPAPITQSETGADIKAEASDLRLHVIAHGADSIQFLKAQAADLRLQAQDPGLPSEAKVRRVHPWSDLEDRMSPERVAKVNARLKEFISGEGTEEGKTAMGEEAGASMEGDASEVRSGGNHESAAEEEIPVTEVGRAGGRGWLGGSLKPLGV